MRSGWSVVAEPEAILNGTQARWPGRTRRQPLSGAQAGDAAGGAAWKARSAELVAAVAYADDREVIERDLASLPGWEASGSGAQPLRFGANQQLRRPPP